MAAISVTATSVVLVSGGPAEVGQAGAAITAGMPIMQLSTDSKWYAADSNNTARLPATRVALNSASADQQVSHVGPGAVIVMGATLTAGMTYVVGGGTAGDINPVADNTTGWYTQIYGIATTTGNMKISLFTAGVPV